MVRPSAHGPGQLPSPGMLTQLTAGNILQQCIICHNYPIQMSFFPARTNDTRCCQLGEPRVKNHFGCYDKSMEINPNKSPGFPEVVKISNYLASHLRPVDYFNPASQMSR